MNFWPGRTPLFSALLTAMIASLVACDSGDHPAVLGGDDTDSRLGLVAQWRFEDGGGDVATDSSELGNTAYIKDGGWGKGQWGGGLQMNGGNDSIVIVPLSESLRSTADAITVMAWAYRSAEHNVAIVAHRYPELFFGFHGSQFKWAIRSELGPWDRAARRLGFSRETRVDCYAAPEHRALLGKWIHVAATFDGETARLYADGTEICSRPIAGSIRMPEAPFTISGYLDKDGAIVDEMTGTLDDVRIYNRALSGRAIRTVYMEGAGSTLQD